MIWLKQLNSGEKPSAGMCFSTADRTLVETDCEPDLMMFSANSEHIVIDDVPTYLSQRMLGNDYYYRRVYNAQYEQKLLLEDYQAEDLHWISVLK
ncbi:hypothetical protein BWQ96_10538 [Gracilariopsis chorda]|uniref:Uncharacterized protein n=1 Tax=Gracilariopsis chorda TaxID=448386 RepID=A0A2V3ICC3_9FLOR|nr:hypothetical protein BWQ96_10538 [Gracilariopsis chorda]|eukprot:PXF39752.1 hypothetical protein BWQ96_10538 [Gracilariopsis chorda]